MKMYECPSEARATFKKNWIFYDEKDAYLEVLVSNLYRFCQIFIESFQNVTKISVFLSNFMN